MSSDINNKVIFIYVGPHKSGSYFLRREIFPYLERVYDLRSKKIQTIDMILAAMDENPLFIGMDSLKKNIYQQLQQIDEEKIIISDPEFFGSYDKQIEGMYYSKQFVDNKYKTQFLHDLFPSAKIIITPRRQDTWIESYYNGIVRGYATLKIDDFLLNLRTTGTDRSHARSFKPCCDINTLDWGIYVRNYFDVFGKENVLVLPQEMMWHDTDEFLDRLYKFMKVRPFHPDEIVRVNRGYSSLSFHIALILNRFVHTRENRFGIIPNRPFFDHLLKRRNRSAIFRFLAGISRRISLRWFLEEVVDKIQYKPKDLIDPESRKYIFDLYRNKNIEYGKLIGIDLSKYRYY